MLSSLSEAFRMFPLVFTPPHFFDMIPPLMKLLRKLLAKQLYRLFCDVILVKQSVFM